VWRTWIRQAIFIGSWSEHPSALLRFAGTGQEFPPDLECWTSGAASPGDAVNDTDLRSRDGFLYLGSILGFEKPWEYARSITFVIVP